MNRFKILACVGLCTLAACQQREVIEENMEETNSSLRMEAMVAGTLSELSRTVTTEKGITSFTAGDAVGLFMPDEDVPIAWTLGEDDKWKAAEAQSWPDKVTKHVFCAFYPFDETDQRDKVPMTALPDQTGTLEGLGTYDFLAARDTCKYSDRNGAVSFVFKHVYSLISVTVKSNISEDAMTLNEISFEGEDMFTSHYYKFATAGGEEDGIVREGNQKPINTLALPTDVVVEDKGHKTLVLINPTENEQTLKISIKYTRNGHTYTASTSNVQRIFESGKLYNITLNLKKGELVVEGNTVTDWTEENIGDLFVDEEPVE